METSELIAAQSPANQTSANALNTNVADDVNAPALPAGVEIELLDLPQTAAMLNYSVKTIRQKISSGLTPRPIRFCRHLRFVKIEIIFWIRYGMPPLNKWELIWQRIRDKI